MLTVRITVLPFLISLPTAGEVEMTLPSATVSLNSSDVSICRLRFMLFSSSFASCSVRFRTSGIMYFSSSAQT